MQGFDVSFYTTMDGEKPAKDFIKSLEPKMRAKMYWTIDKLADNGNKLREPHSKHLQDGIFELRVHVGSDISRVLYFFLIGQRVVLTNGFIKKTQETPQNEIERALRYRKDYMNREGRS
jgi:phage-related protein